MTRTLLCAAAAALATGLAAHAQAPSYKTGDPPTATSPPAKNANATASQFKTGMTVKDSAGVTVGKIAKLSKTADGAPAVAVKVDGKTVNIAASSLSLSSSGDQAVSTMTKAEIKAAAPGG